MAFESMATSESTNVFVSYSHADSSLVAPVVQLLRLNKSLVFHDIDSIRPGRKWRGEIARALADSSLVVVFWCEHASHSEEVAKEWKAAIDQKKDLLPLLLDATPLPAQLGEYQWIDFRGTVGANHGLVNPPADGLQAGAPSAAPARSVRWLPFAGLAAALVVAVALSLILPHLPQSPSPIAVPGPPGPAPAPLPPPPPAETFDFAFRDPGVLLLPLIAAALMALIAWWLLRRSIRAKPVERAGAPAGEVERRMASEVEAEILRRTALRRESNA
jgi:hypothetical protein